MQSNGNGDPRTESREAARRALKELVERYERERDEFIKPGSTYNEARLRSDFIDPLVKILGWDVDNREGLPQALRDVVLESSIAVQDDDDVLREKNPDYEFRRGGYRALFWEAKRPSVAIASHRESAFQLRRYGWSAGMRISVLTNFEHLIVYDTRFAPDPSDGPQAGRRLTFTYTDYVDRFDELYDLLSRDAVYSGSLERAFPDAEAAGAEPFDRRFLALIEGWRENLATALIEENVDKNLDSRIVNTLVQRLINRIIFLRICEGRQLETYERLKSVTSYEKLKDVFREADRRYNSGLFDFATDSLSLDVSLASDILVDIFHDLYMPSSPYAFSVVDPALLGEIYETFLGKEVSLDGNSAEIVEKPEVLAASGVVVTPHHVAAKIVAEALDHLVEGRTPEELSTFAVADLASGSGTFLLAAYTYLLNYHLKWYAENGVRDPSLIIDEGAGHFRLTLAEKQRILVDMIYGVDIDIQAVEVARFSLLLKLIEGETPETIRAASRQSGAGALPNLGRNIIHGNSLVDNRFFDHDPSALANTDLVDKLRPTQLSDKFPQVAERGGFDAIVGNPPYVRIQHMSTYSPEELAYYRSEASPYESASSDNIDKYYLFVERGLEMLRQNGRLGFILPHRFFHIKAGKKLRELLANGRHLSSVAHFGTYQVFPGRSTYTAVITLNRQPSNTFQVEIVNDVEAWAVGQHEPKVNYDASEIDGNPWVFVSSRARAVFDRLTQVGGVRLDSIADIFVGLQTSADAIYIQSFADFSKVFDIVTGTFLTPTVTFAKDDMDWEVEASLLVPCMLDAPLGPFQQARPNAAMIFPYESGTRTPIPPSRMATDFPLAWQYLQQYKTDLEARSLQSGSEDEWYRFGRSQSLTKFDGTPNLVWSTLATDAPYAVDESGSVRFTGGGNGPYYGLRMKEDPAVSMYYVLAVLSHPVIEALVKSRAVTFRGDYYSHGKQFIASLPIVLPPDEAQYEEIVKTAKDLARVSTELTKSPLDESRETTLKTQYLGLRQRLVEQVGAAYGFSDADIEAVSGQNLRTPTIDED